jgi:CHAT domain-containing protein
VLRVDALLLPEPIAENLKETKYLVVVPVLGIGSVPFALLQPFSGSEYLVDKMSVSVAPSLFDIAKADDRSENFDRLLKGHASVHFTFGPSLVVGNPVASSDPDWIFPPLPGAAKEATAVATMVGSEALTGRIASKSNVLDRLDERTDFLYFATHGVSDPENPVAGSFLVLSGSTRDEIRWTAREIQSRQLDRESGGPKRLPNGFGEEPRRRNHRTGPRLSNRRSGECSHELVERG